LLVDPDQFPIYDSYAVKMLTYHLNGKGREGLSYEQFAAGSSALKDALSFPMPEAKSFKIKATVKRVPLWWAGPYIFGGLQLCGQASQTALSWLLLYHDFHH
jgi:hypothetical protein